jgi:hypothetical protein
VTERHPGEWPVGKTVGHGQDDGELYAQRAAEQARHEMVLGSIRAHLEEQPSRASVMSAARRWCADIFALAGEVAKKLRGSG